MLAAGEHRFDPGASIKTRWSDRVRVTGRAWRHAKGSHPVSSGGVAPELTPAAFGRGAIIGRYVVLGLIGRGGMGEVYARLRSRARPQDRAQAASREAGQRRLSGRGAPAAAARGAGDRPAVAPQRGRRLRRRDVRATRCSSPWSSSRATPLAYWLAAADAPGARCWRSSSPPGAGWPPRTKRAGPPRLQARQRHGRRETARCASWTSAWRARRTIARRNVPPTTPPRAHPDRDPSIAHMMGSEDTVVLQASGSALGDAVPEGSAATSPACSTSASRGRAP